MGEGTIGLNPSLTERGSAINELDNIRQGLLLCLHNNVIPG
ncbi:MAG: hypothetical protein LZF86_110061 [Nitrospira sp.]|nr:MAG: hypothetical protein LZF86_110061 [Nitrospira sp.]